MLAWIVIAALLSGASATPADNTAAIHEFLDGRLRVQLPSGYEMRESPDGEPGVIFVRRGDWAAALDSALPKTAVVPPVDVR